MHAGMAQVAVDQQRFSPGTSQAGSQLGSQRRFALPGIGTGDHHHAHAIPICRAKQLGAQGVDCFRESALQAERVAGGPSRVNHAHVGRQCRQGTNQIEAEILHDIGRAIDFA